MKSHALKQNSLYSSMTGLSCMEDAVSTAVRRKFFQADNDLGVEAACSTALSAAPKNKSYSTLVSSHTSAWLPASLVGFDSNAHAIFCSELAMMEFTVLFNIEGPARCGSMRDRSKFLEECVQV